MTHTADGAGARSVGSRWFGPVLVLVALLVITTSTELIRRSRLSSIGDVSRPSTPSSFSPHPLEPFSATALDGREVGTATWAGRVVVLNVWATWCAPCRREIPALSALQRAYADRILVLGILDDNVSDDFARAFATSVGLAYPIVRTSFELEGRLPYIGVLPMTFVVDGEGRLAHMYAGEIEPARLEADVQALLGEQ